MGKKKTRKTRWKCRDGECKRVPVKTAWECGRHVWKLVYVTTAKAIGPRRGHRYVKLWCCDVCKMPFPWDSILDKKPFWTPEHVLDEHVGLVTALVIDPLISRLFNGGWEMRRVEAREKAMEAKKLAKKRKVRRGR